MEYNCDQLDVSLAFSFLYIIKSKQLVDNYKSVIINVVAKEWSMMNTNEIVIRKIKAWLAQHDITYQVLADKLDVSKSLVGHMLAGERTLLPERIEKIAELMDLSVAELMRDESFQTGPLTYKLRGKTSSRVSKRELEALLFAIEDYVALKEQVS